jgi:hypothetical protein
MMPADTTDPLFRMLGRLEAAVPSASREKRVRARCHAVLARCQQRQNGVGGRVLFAPLVHAALAVAASLYLSEVVRQAWRLSHPP